MVEEVWNKYVSSSDPVDILNIKLKRFKKHFKGWGSSLFGHTRKKKKELKEELVSLEEKEESVPSSPDDFVRKTNILVELHNIYADEEIYWLQRSSEKWLLHGDQNSAYFHRVANGRRRRNMIHFLKDGEVVIEGTGNLLKHAIDYYKTLFGPAPGNSFRLDSNLWSLDETLTLEDNCTLTKPFTLEEIEVSLFSMDKNKAPGPDNIPIEFFQHCWGVVNHDIMRLFHHFHDGTLDIKRLNYGVITLLPKISGADKITQYRPICLLRCIYKLITKTLTLRLEPFSSKLFSIQQNAFIKKRNIMDGVLSLHELLNYTHVKKHCGIVLKLDFEKAYDKVNWEYLLECHKIRGFNEKWCCWVKQSLVGGTVSVKLNNEMGPYFQSAKGVRQGDPLAPTLFNLVAESLTKMVLKAQENELLVGLAPDLIHNGVAVLQYADDTVLCFSHDPDKAINLKLLLYMFELMSGLKINFLRARFSPLGVTMRLPPFMRICLAVRWDACL
jgi:hypothetical protein